MDWLIFLQNDLNFSGYIVIVCALTLSLRNFWHPFSHSVRNFFLDARKITGMVTKMGISRLVIKLDIKAVHHWNCE